MTHDTTTLWRIAPSVGVAFSFDVQFFLLLQHVVLIQVSFDYARDVTFLTELCGHATGIIRNLLSRPCGALLCPPGSTST